jgi:hypothetical protein
VAETLRNPVDTRPPKGKTYYLQADCCLQPSRTRALSRQFHREVNVTPVIAWGQCACKHLDCCLRVNDGLASHTATQS